MDIEARVSRLERKNRTLKGIIVLGVLSLSLPWIMGQRATGVQPAIRAERLELIDRDGRLAARLRPARALDTLTGRSGVGAVLEFFGADTAHPVLILSGGTDGGALMLTKRDDFGLMLPRGFLFVRGSKVAANLGVEQGDTYLTLSGDGGEAVLGNTSTTDKRTGATTRFPVSTLTLYDADGNVRYRAP